MATELLSVEAIRVSYGAVKALDQVSLRVAEGEVVSVIGANGAGKTTCFNLVNGQLQADRGSIVFDGREISGLTPQKIWRQGVARTFQVTATFATMTVRENVQMALLSHHAKLLSLFRRASHAYQQEAMRLLARVGMVEQAERSCGVLAYGDLKRVELAMALANQPRLLLMDEPTAGMAPKARLELMALAAQFTQDQGISVLFTEHDMDVVFTHADDIIVLNRGRVIASGPPQRVRHDPRVQEVYLGEGAVLSSEVAPHA